MGVKNKSGFILGSVCLGLCVCVSDLSLVKEKINLTHNVPQAVPHWVIEVQCLGAVGLRIGRGKVFGCHV